MREVRCKLKYLKVLACALAWLAQPALSPAAQPEVVESHDLKADARAAEARSLPILLSFTSSTCGYCEQLEEWFLKPMLISGDYDDKILIRKVMIDNHDTLVDFDGNRVDADLLASRYRVTVVPTVLFLDARGRELTDRMVGINTLEFYGGYLDNNIHAALNQVRGEAN